MPTIEGVLPYGDWRKIHFDEETCCPLGGHSGTPAQVLDESPVVRHIIVKLVSPDNEQGSLTDADVWARYFYQIYLLDLGEERRRKILSERRISTKSPAQEIGKASSSDKASCGKSSLYGTMN